VPRNHGGLMFWEDGKNWVFKIKLKIYLPENKKEI
jgi:hypothetical protein